MLSVAKHVACHIFRRVYHRAAVAQESESFILEFTGDVCPERQSVELFFRHHAYLVDPYFRLAVDGDDKLGGRVRLLRMQTETVFLPLVGDACD